MKSLSPEEQLAGFLAKYTPDIAALAGESLAKLRARLPGAIELVYDNYNALAIGFGPTERTSDAILSIAVYPRWVSLFFLQGAHFPDPQRLLKGNGNQVRHIVLDEAVDLEKPEIEALIAHAVDGVKLPSDASHVIIKSISAKQRPRRPTKLA